jgi:hypothetical protein
MSTTRNRYSVQTRHHLPRRKHRIPIRGDLEDANRYFRCWYCGFTCDSDRDVVGDGDGVIQLDTPEISMGGFCEGDKLAITVVLDDFLTILENGPDGNPITHYEHNQFPRVISGCPNCGSLNYK